MLQTPPFAGVVTPQKARERKGGPEMPPQHLCAVRGRYPDEVCIEPVVDHVALFGQGFQERGAVGGLGIEECPVQIEDDRRSCGDCSASFVSPPASASPEHAGHPCLFLLVSAKTRVAWPSQAMTERRRTSGEQSQAQRVPCGFGTKPCASCYDAPRYREIRTAAAADRYNSTPAAAVRGRRPAAGALPGWRGSAAAHAPTGW